jgi:hypothetical protein
MSQEYDNEKRGVLFKNDHKESEKHPDYKGSCEIEGVEYWVAAWVKEGRKGKFMSMSFEVKEERQEDRRPPPREARRDDRDDRRPPPQRQQTQAPRQAPRREEPPAHFDDMDDIPF